MLTENVMISFLRKFDEYPFIVKLKGKEYRIGDGDPAFTVIFHKEIPLTALTTSTSLALGEAYMDGDLEIEGDLYNALDHFLGQMGKFSTDESALKKLIFSSTGKKNQEKEVQSHYDIGNDFYKLWLDETMSYSCGYFLHEDDSLYQAQVNKVDYILKKLHFSTLAAVGDFFSSRRQKNTAFTVWESRSAVSSTKRLIVGSRSRIWEIFWRLRLWITGICQR